MWKRNKGMTAQDVFEKAKEASAKLENVRTHISYDDFWKTTAPEERYSVKYEMTSDAMLQPEIVKQRCKSATATAKWGSMGCRSI